MIRITTETTFNCDTEEEALNSIKKVMKEFKDYFKKDSAIRHERGMCLNWFYVSYKEVTGVKHEFYAFYDEKESSDERTDNKL